MPGPHRTPDEELRRRRRTAEAPNREVGDMEAETYNAAREAGVEPIRELFETDPRARMPYCSHGVPFVEFCETCEAVEIRTDAEVNRPAEAAAREAGYAAAQAEADRLAREFRDNPQGLG